MPIRVPSLVVASLLLAGAADDAEAVAVSVDVKLGGGVTWAESPCQLAALRGGEEIASGSGTIEITPGPTIVTATCTTSAGVPVKKSLRQTITKAAKLSMSMAPATMSFTVTSEGTKSAARVVVYDDNDVEVAAGDNTKKLLVDAGPKRFVGLIDRGGGKVIQGETQQVVKGSTGEVNIVIAQGELMVSVNENGRPAAAVVSLHAPGEERPRQEIVVGEVTSIDAGTWDLVSQLSESHDFRAITSRIVVQPGKKTTKLIAHTTGALTIATEPAEGVLVELFRPSEAAPFNQLDPGTKARLSPGPYSIKATETGRTLDDGSKPTVVVKTSVGAGSNGKVTLRPVVADVEVSVRVGKAAPKMPMTVSLSLPDAAAPFVSRAVDEAGVARFAVSPQDMVVSTRIEAPQGPIEVSQKLAAKGGKNRATLTLQVGSVLHQVMDAGVAAPATVRYFAKPKGKAPMGEAVLAVKAGQIAWLPAGPYLVEVERRDEKRPFGELKVVAGEAQEGSLEWAPPPAPAPAPAPTDVAGNGKTTPQASGAKDGHGPEVKKPDDKKSEGKKPEGKKPEDKKSESKKPEGKKPEDKKPEAAPAPKKS